jgi:hypothetical protein
LGVDGVAVSVDLFSQRFPRDELHDDPTLLLFVEADVVDANQIGVPQIQAMANATHFDFEVLLNSLQGNFFARFAFGEINFAKAPRSNATFDDEAIEGSISISILELHRSTDISLFFWLGGLGT